MFIVCVKLASEARWIWFYRAFFFLFSFLFWADGVIFGVSLNRMTMKAERQQKEATSRVIQPSKGGRGYIVDNRPNTIIQSKALLELKNYGSSPIQCFMDMLELDKEKYHQLCRNKVILLALLDDNPVGDEGGFFFSSSKGHAEENLIKYIEDNQLQPGKLEIYLSTSPCSSEFGTRKEDDMEGCAEQLEKLKSKGFNISVEADHPYQPKELSAAERDWGEAAGTSSLGAIGAYGYELGNVAQLWHLQTHKVSS